MEVFRVTQNFVTDLVKTVKNTRALSESLFIALYSIVSFRNIEYLFTCITCVTANEILYFFYI